VYNQSKQEYRTRVNNYIRANEVRVILADGTTKGIMPTNEALSLARSQNLDLVEINGKVSPPIVKIVEYGKFKYDEKKKKQSQKQKTSELKEISFRPTTDPHDLAHKLAAAKKFLADGDRVKFSVYFRGREMAHTELGREKLQWVVDQLTDIGSVNGHMASEGKTISLIVAPK
jgi:translation initiation factor IF-3